MNKYTLLLWNARKSKSSHPITHGTVYHIKAEKLLKGLWDAIRKASQMIYRDHMFCVWKTFSVLYMELGGLHIWNPIPQFNLYGWTILPALIFTVRHLGFVHMYFILGWRNVLFLKKAYVMSPKFSNASILNAPVKTPGIQRTLITHPGQTKPLQSRAFKFPYENLTSKHLQFKFSC